MKTMSEPQSIINHGVIEEMTLPPGFSPVALGGEAERFNLFEYQLSPTLRICYEQSNYPLMEEDQAALATIFAERLSDDSPSRKLNFNFDDKGNPESDDDMAAYRALCQAFVFGGRLVAGGACIDEEESIWEVRRVGSGDGARTMIAGRLRFLGPGGAEKRHALLVIPVPPGAAGSGYLWLEGTAAEIDKAEPAFLDAVACATFRQLPEELVEDPESLIQFPEDSGD